jgi:L-ascorbate metabolism protein UlaG (beta-lactamase superfamily)
MLIDKIHWLGHAAFRIETKESINIYIDPFKLKNADPKADIILITHDHFDHCSDEDIEKIYKPSTVIIGPKSVSSQPKQTVKNISAGQTIKEGDIKITAVASYNPSKEFHPKAAENVGYVLEIEGEKVYHAGDTDLIDEMKDIKTDIALLPVGGTYTMDYEQALKAVETIKPKIAVPMHYGKIVGSVSDAQKFKEKCSCEVRILKEE